MLDTERRDVGLAELRAVVLLALLHVAGTVGSATYGVAKNVNLIAVKICTSGGSCPSAAILCGIDYATQQKQVHPSITMVANMPIRGH